MAPRGCACSHAQIPIANLSVFPFQTVAIASYNLLSIHSLCYIASYSVF